MSNALGKYIDFLLEQLQQDMHVISIGWVHWTVLPMMIYFVFFLFKWWMLLVPITMPMTIWMFKPQPTVTSYTGPWPPPSAKN